ncbi:hypothetical protein L226DRAFT_469518 [Lentinus tigrinus ALCF2SS1-7]|uniref:uncharacterized protein n=1 Tax=Lentinus tigrinus ALCF2SS1-7 TaxID=1328758 RepID=UPI00116636FF|nr:hypothetical protein L226DRAFT_469518 [Lentinus tigrinus ALCF2SS1-7]
MAPAGQQLRIAIALAALRHKPAEQSIQAYILDLQAAFPSYPAADCHRASSPNPWRDRVLALERDLKELHEQYDKEKLGAFRHSIRVSCTSRSLSYAPLLHPHIFPGLFLCPCKE